MKKIFKSEAFLYVVILIAFIGAFLTVYLKTEKKLDTLRNAVPVVIHDVTYEEGQEEEKTVYTTASGKKYHLEGCTYLDDKRIALSLKDAVNAGYEECKYCQP